VAITTAMATSFKSESWMGHHNFAGTGTVTLTSTGAGSTTWTGSSSDVSKIPPGTALSGTGVAASTFVASHVNSTAVGVTAANNAALSAGSVTYLGDTFWLALYTSSASMDATTTAYSATNEASGTGYTAGGKNLVVTAPATSSTTVYVDFADLVFSTVTLTARGCLIYNGRGTTAAATTFSSVRANRAVSVHDFGADKSASSGDFTIVFPTPDSTNAILRFS
jgi:hypothetical protein